MKTELVSQSQDSRAKVLNRKFQSLDLFGKFEISHKADGKKWKIADHQGTTGNQIFKAWYHQNRNHTHNGFAQMLADKIKRCEY